MYRVQEMVAGARFLIAGFRSYARNPRLVAIGILPGLIVGLIMLALLIVLAMHVGGFAAWLTPFAASWDVIWRDGVRLLVAAGILAGAVALCVLTFAGLTLAIGEPFFERIWRAIERQLGGVPDEVDRPFWVAVRAGIADGVKLIGIGILTALVVFLVGLVPLVGGVVGAVVGATLGGRALATELTGMAGDARGLRLAQRQGLLRSRRWRSLGFGVACYLLFLVPGGAVLGMPAAIAGGTLLLRDLRGEPTTAVAAS